MKIRFVLLLLALLALLFSATSAVSALNPGDTAPDFAARTLDGKRVHLRDFEGRKLLLEIGTSWCPSCKQLAHQLDGLRGLLREKDVVHLAVFLGDSAESVAAYFSNEKLEKPDQILIDADSARKAYGVYVIPRLILIDTDFRILFDEFNGHLAALKSQLDP